MSCWSASWKSNHDLIEQCPIHQTDVLLTALHGCLDVLPRRVRW